MAFWSGETLAAKGGQVFEPFAPGQIDCNAYNLRIGDQYFTTATRDEGASTLQRRMQLKENESFLIPPGQFAFLLSKEIVKIPADAMAFISMRTGIKFQGLINVSGFHVDPGYEGKLVYAVYNASPSTIELAEGALVFKIWLCALDQQSQPPYVKPRNEGKTEITAEMLRGMDREILSLQMLSNKLRDQQHDIDKKFSEQKPIMDHLFFVWRATTLGVIGTLIISILTLAFPTLRTVGEALGRKITSHFSLEQSDRNATTPTGQQPSGATKPPP